jgi:Methylase involved in ubiquinone/menaquinone biosynthesis
MGEEVKEKVKEYYGNIAKKVNSSSKSSCCSAPSCCSSSGCSDTPGNSSIYNLEYLKGLPAEAVNASLGCANPLSIAGLKMGETVLDLGSGGGIDVFIASRYVGREGYVYGLDMTDEMLALANKNKSKMGVANVEFIKGYIEDIPLKEKSVDVVLSNCVINLCESKEKALSEAYRVLKTGGRLTIADIVVLKDIPEDIKKSAEMWVGCIAGALPVKEYEDILSRVGFKNIEIKPVNIYTRDIIESIRESKKLQGIGSNADISLLDGAFAGAFVRAVK